MNIAPFALEEYFARYEFNATHLLSSSDCEALGMAELLAMADADTRRMWDELALGYTESPGHPVLREDIAGLYEQIGADDVLVTVPEEGIFLFVHALLEAGDHVVCTFPGYQSLYEIARSLGCGVSTWDAEEEAAGWSFDVDRLQGLLQEQTRLIVINFPHNPTGYVPPREDFERLLNLARERGIFVLSDEMYRFLELRGGSALPPACDLYEQAFSLGGLSKTFGLPGLRVGWLASRSSEVLRRATGLKYYTTICGSAPSEVLAMIGLRNRGAIVERQLAKVRANLGVLEAFMAEHEARFDWRRPLGGSICLPRLHHAAGAYEFCERAVRETGIMLVPSSVFLFGDEHVRFGFGRDDLPEVLGLFGEYLRSAF